MQRRKKPAGAIEVQTLESRRLLSFTPFGREGVVAGTDSSASVDVGVADNGSYVIASAASVGGTTNITATRYNAAGVPVAPAATLASFAGGGGQVAASMDADGDAVIVYRMAEPLGIY